jgi:nitroimidazol reductase NimA-like FMN-containing flavoprotein (pyridoxamine 5'-phosphate oxidase superfamily)
MVDRTNGDAREVPEHEREAQAREPVVQELNEADSLRLISAGGIGRIAYTSRFGPAVLPVNYKLYEGTIVFRTALGSPLDEDLRTGISGAEYHVAFEIDEIDLATREGWSVLIQGSAHHVDSEAERAPLIRAGVEPWPGGDRELFVRIIPRRITGRHIRRSGSSASG